MTDRCLYLLAQFDKTTQEILAEYYDILERNGFIGSQTKNIPYHITLGKKEVEYEKQIISDLSIICANTDHIDIHLSHVGLFDLSVLFIAPDMNFELLTLQQKLFPHCGHGTYHWTAHVTLLIDEPEVILEALPVVSANFKPFKARIESIGLYEFFPKRFIMDCSLNTAS